MFDPAVHERLRARATRPDLWPVFLPPPWRTDWDDDL
jgi:hypothetical protein